MVVMGDMIEKLLEQIINESNSDKDNQKSDESQL